MKLKLSLWLSLAAVSATTAWAGGLRLEVGNPQANAEAKGLDAALVARVSACTEPAKSKVTAAFIVADAGQLRSTPLKIIPLKTPGVFAILGTIPRGSVIDVGVTNPEYDHYQPRVLLRHDPKEVQWATIKRFTGSAPTDADLRSILGKTD